MANDIKTSVSADVNFRPSNGETLDEYTACLSQALKDLATSDEVKALLASGNPVTINVEGMNAEATEDNDECCDACSAKPELEEAPSFDIADFLDARINEFISSNRNSIFKLGAKEFKNIIYSFFEKLTDTPLRKKVSGPSEMAKRFISSL